MPTGKLKGIEFFVPFPTHGFTLKLEIQKMIHCFFSMCETLFLSFFNFSKPLCDQHFWIQSQMQVTSKMILKFHLHTTRLSAHRYIANGTGMLLIPPKSPKSTRQRGVASISLAALAPVGQLGICYQWFRSMLLTWFFFKKIPINQRQTLKMYTS